MSARQQNTQVLGCGYISLVLKIANDYFKAIITLLNLMRADRNFESDFII